MNATTNTTVQSNTTATELTPLQTVDQDKLMAQLELVDRHGDDFTYAELSNIAWDLNLALQELIAKSTDERLTIYIETARNELQQVLQPASPTQTLSNRLIVVILLLGRSAIRQARQGVLITG